MGIPTMVITRNNGTISNYNGMQGIKYYSYNLSTVLSYMLLTMEKEKKIKCQNKHCSMY